MGTYITDPCVWSPELPMLYAAEVDAAYTSGDEYYNRGHFAFRHLVPRRRSLYLNGKRWVLRAAYDHGGAPSAEVAQWREHFNGRVAVWRNDRVLFADASRLGLAIVAEPTNLRCELGEAFRGMARQPSITIVLLQSDQVPPPETKKEYPSLCLAQRVARAEMVAPWADVAWMNVGSVDEFAEHSRDITLPIIAVRRYHGSSLAEARAAIDTLQADLAPIGQFAGYVV